MQILTVVLGVVFILLLLSLLASTIMEFISSIFGLRGQNLLKALKNLLEGYKAGEGAVVDKQIYEQFIKNPLYRQLSFRYGADSSKTSPPSYISAKSFQSILFDILLGNEILIEDQRLEDLILQKINELENEDLKKVLRQLWRDADGNIDTFKKKVEEWYNSVMERATGWYKRSTQYILVGVGFTIAVVLNADTLAIYERLENNPEVAERIASIAENLSTKDTITVDNAVLAIDQVGGPDTAAASITIDTLALDPTDSEEDRQAKLNYNARARELTTMVNRINTYRSPLGMGWKNVNFNNMDALAIGTKILGWLVTALAISLGAPFWFDILKKVVNLRGAGKRPDDDD